MQTRAVRGSYEESAKVHEQPSAPAGGFCDMTGAWLCHTKGRGDNRCKNKKQSSVSAFSALGHCTRSLTSRSHTCRLPLESTTKKQPGRVSDHRTATTADVPMPQASSQVAAAAADVRS